MTDLVFFDTETTGFPDFRARHGDLSQPHLVQIAAHRTDQHGNMLDEFMALVNPEGWYLEIPKEASDAHGITYERAMAEGQDFYKVMRRFNKILRGATPVAHNRNFDIKIIKIAWTRTDSWVNPDPFLTSICTMELCKPIVNLPPTEKMLRANRRGPKPPTLTECHQFFFGEAFANAHDALADTRVCAKVFFAAREFQANQAKGAV